MLRIAQYVSSSNLGLPAVPLQEAIDKASKFNALKVVSLLSDYSLVLQNGGTSSEPFKGFTAQLFFGPLVCRLLDGLLRSSTKPLEFIYPQQFRLVINLFMRYGSWSGGRDLTEDAVREIGTLLLSAPETFHIEVPQPVLIGTPDKDLALAVEFDHNAHLVSEGYSMDIRRILPLKGAVLARVLAQQDYGQRFESHFGFRPEELQAGLVALFAGFGQATVQQAQVSKPVRLDLRQVFGFTETPQHIVNYILTNYVHRFEASKEDRPSPSKQSTDLGALAHKPFLETARYQLCCLDRGFANGVLSRCLFKAAEEALAASGLNMRDLWGDALESYVTDQLAQIRAARPKARVFPPIKSTEREHDGLYLEDGSLVVMEVKSGVVGVSTRMSGDPQRVRKELWEKFIYGPGKEKGFRQIATRMRRILAKPVEYGLPRPHTVIPLLVVEDDFVAGSLVQEFARKVSVPFFEGFGGRVGSPVIVNAIDLYWLAHRAPTIGLTDALVRYSRSPFVRLVPFGTWLSTEFPSSGDAVIGKTQEVEDFDPYLNKAFEILEARIESEPTNECDRCRNPWDINQLHVEGPRWWCPKCGNTRAPSDAELSKHETWYRSMIERYEERAGEP